MTAQRADVDRMLATWLVDGVDTAPPPVVRAALEQVSATRQRRELGLMRRFYNVEATAPVNRNAWLRVGLLGMASVVAIIAVAGVVKLLAPEVASPAMAPATALVTDLRSPPDTREVARSEGSDAIAVLRERMRVAVFDEAVLNDLGGEAAAAVFDADGVSDQRQYVAAALTFDHSAAAVAAMGTIRANLRFATGQWAMGNSPFTDEHVPLARDEGFERSGTYWAFGGTSAGASSRVGHLNVWRIDDVVFIVFGVDWVTPGSPSFQTAIEAGVMAVSEELAARLR